MKINNMGIPTPPALSERDVGNKLEKTGSYFSSDLYKARDDQYKERMNALLDKITEQGSKLGQVPTYSELKTYRDLVRKFIGEAVSRSYSLQTQIGWDRQGRQKMYTTIKKVDSTMESMAEDIRYGQDRQMDIMAKQDAIRGLLVDLYT